MDDSQKLSSYYMPLSMKSPKRVKTEIQNTLNYEKVEDKIKLPNIMSNGSNFQSYPSSQREIGLVQKHPPKYIQQDLDDRKSLLKLISSKIWENLNQNFKNALSNQQKQGNLQVQINRKIRAKPSKPLKKHVDTDLNYEEDNDDDKSQIHLPPLTEKCLQLFWVDVDQTLWRPPVRESCAMTVHNNILYLYGGIGLEMYGDLLKVDIHSFKWSYEPLSFLSILDEPKKRYGLTMTASKNALYVYGGETHTRASIEKQLCPDMHKYDIESKSWKILKSNGLSIEARRSHAADFIGRNLIIIGGIGKRGKYLSDFVAFNIKSNNYSYLTLEADTNPFKEGIGYHTICSIFKYDKFSVNLYQSNNSESDEEEPTVRKEGIYIFGGLNQNNIPYGEMYLLQTQLYPNRIQQLKIKGVKPPPLCMHTMVYNEQTSYLIIYGGKTELTSTIFNKEIFVLSLKYLLWIKVNQKGNNIPSERAGHSAVSTDSRIVIFGGFNLSGYVSSSLAVIELNKQGIMEQENQLKIPKRKKSNIEQLLKKSEIKSLNQIDYSMQRKEIIQQLNQNSILLKESILFSPISSFKRSKGQKQSNLHQSLVENW